MANPIDTAKMVGRAIRKSNEENGLSHTIGQGMFDVGLLVVPGGIGVHAAKGTARVASSSSKMAKLSSMTGKVVKGSRVSKVMGATGKASARTGSQMTRFGRWAKNGLKVSAKKKAAGLAGGSGKGGAAGVASAKAGAASSKAGTGVAAADVAATTTKAGVATQVVGGFGLNAELVDQVHKYAVLRKISRLAMEQDKLGALSKTTKKSIREARS